MFKFYIEYYYTIYVIILPYHLHPPPNGIYTTSSSKDSDINSFFFSVLIFLGPHLGRSILLIVPGYKTLPLLHKSSELSLRLGLTHYPPLPFRLLYPSLV